MVVRCRLKIHSWGKLFSKMRLSEWWQTVIQSDRIFSCHRMTNEPAHEIKALIVPRKLILQTCMCRHPLGIDVWCLVGYFVYFHTSCVRTAKALARLCACAGSPEHSLVAYVLSTIISWARSNINSFSCIPLPITLKSKCLMKNDIVNNMTL